MPRRGDEGVGPERRRLLELHGDGVLIDLLDRDVAIGAAGDRGRRGIARVLPGEDDVVGGEGLAVVPFHALLQLPGHRLAVGGERAVLAARDRSRPGSAAGCPRRPSRRAARRTGASRPGPWCRRRSADSARSDPATTGPSEGHRRRAWSACRSAAIAPSPRPTGREADWQRAPPAPPPPYAARRRDATVAPAFTWSNRPRKSRSSMDASHPDVEAVLSLTLLLSCKMRAKRMGTGPPGAVNGRRSSSSA